MNESAKLFAGLCHPARLEILEALIKSKGCVSELQLRTGRNQPNLSQHLRVLRYARLVDYRKEGRNVCYFVSRPEVAKLLKIAKEMYPEGEHG